MKKIFSLLCLISSSCFATAPDFDVIYGEDNRQDVYQSSDSLLVDLSRATAALIPPEYLKPRGSEYEISGKTLMDRGICQSERFSEQVSVASCSGFLVAANILVTAGHCVKTQSNCDSAKWVFDYKISGSKNAVRVPASSVYECKRIISRALNPVTKQDFAVIELDSPVRDRRALTIRKSGRISVGESVAVIGHPSGLPTKITDQGEVRSLQQHFFVTNLDTYHGNSGSPVINSRSGEVEGILVRGDSDFVRTSSGCQVSKVCTSHGCRGEDVSYITDVEGLHSF